MSKRNKIVIIIYCIFSAILMLSTIIQSIIDSEVSVFSILLCILTTATFVLMLIDLKFVKKWYLLIADIAVPILLSWNLGFGVTCIVCHYNSLFFSIFNIVLTLVLGAIIIVKIILDIVDVQKSFSTPEKKRQRLNQDQIIKIMEKLQELHNNKVLTDEEYEENRKKYVEML